MLLLLALANLFTRSSPVSGNSLESRGEAASCDNINNCRTLFGIISGCLATIFACTWVSVHPNVPPPGLGTLALSWRRFCMMLVAVIAPEVMAGFAARQFFDACWFSKEYAVSLTHGFFFTMGGFVSQNGHPIVKEEQLCLRPEYIKAIQRIRVEDIEDKSKGDSLSKGVILLQGLWFMIQCLARIQQHLPLTELEVATLAFQFVNIFIWLLWWHKPLDVQQPVLLTGTHTKDNELPHSSLRTNRQTWWREMIWEDFTPTRIITGDYSDFDPESSTSVPPFWSMDGPYHEYFPRNFIIVECAMGTIFGAIHCAAWNATFPSVHEMLMWRSCSPVVAALPFLMTLSDMTQVLVEMTQVQQWAKLTVQVPCRIVFTISIPAYIVARLVLIVLSLATLRTLPLNTFMDVNWSRYIPHF
ncbi:hypothetical protein MVEN_00431900 [Mycena venus]|uniref:Uncharacterized protein n=1 Tax=Mycena venus TaxID=2733690 RepID=A0A8H6YXD9_9AGAR|nr:hypothetical protein MVEN_00431900 [Mycena venus]